MFLCGQARVPNKHMNDDEFNPDKDLAPLPSRATRKIAKRSKASSRGAIVVKLPADGRTRIIQFESKLEQRVLWLLLATKDISDIWEQPPSLTYINHEGKYRLHTFDFLIAFTSGCRLAIAVKPARLVHKNKFIQDLKCIRKAMHKDYADRLVLVTDQDFTTAEALNAQRFHEFRRHINDAALIPLMKLLEVSIFPTTIKNLAEKLDAGGAGYRTVFVAIYERLLSADRTRLIDMDTIVSRGYVK